MSSIGTSAGKCVLIDGWQGSEKGLSCSARGNPNPIAKNHIVVSGEAGAEREERSKKLVRGGDV